MSSRQKNHALRLVLDLCLIRPDGRTVVWRQLCVFFGTHNAIRFAGCNRTTVGISLVLTSVARRPTDALLSLAISALSALVFSRQVHHARDLARHLQPLLATPLLVVAADSPTGSSIWVKGVLP